MGVERELVDVKIYAVNFFDALAAGKLQSESIGHKSGVQLFEETTRMGYLASTFLPFPFWLPVQVGQVCETRYLRGTCSIINSIPDSLFVYLNIISPDP